MKSKYILSVMIGCAVAAAVGTCLVSLNTRKGMSERADGYIQHVSLPDMECEESEFTSAGISQTDESELEVETAALPPILLADIEVGSIFDTAKEIDGILTLDDTLSDKERLVAEYFQNLGWHFIIMEISAVEEEDAGVENLPELVRRTGVTEYYSIICEDTDYIAVIADDRIQYEEEGYE